MMLLHWCDCGAVVAVVSLQRCRCSAVVAVMLFQRSGGCSDAVPFARCNLSDGVAARWKHWCVFSAVFALVVVA